MSESSRKGSEDGAIFTYEISDEALEAAAGDYLEVRCSQCGGSCNSSCTKNTNKDTRAQYDGKRLSS